MPTKLLSADAIRRALTLRDLTDADQGPHAVQRLLDDAESAIGIPVRRARLHPVVSVDENYDALRVGPDAVSRDARYTRYLNDEVVLRTHTSAMIPVLLRELSKSPPDDILLSCPGVVYRRDAIDREHTGEPHQCDLWRIRSKAPALSNDDLDAMIAAVASALLPGREWRIVPATHPYTLNGRQVDVRDGDGWLEIAECGLAHPDVLSACGLERSTGLAMGIGLDRILMMRKGIPDIRLLRSTDPRVTAQMLDLEAYRPVSSMPPVRRDLSIAIAHELDDEELGDRVRQALGRDADAVEEVRLVSSTAHDDLPVAARERLGMCPGQRNVLISVVLRAIDRTLTDEEANILRDRIYGVLHEGSVHVWASEGAALTMLGP